jgi:hypothetical protein
MPTKFYVSLTYDLIGSYLEFKASSSESVRRYLTSKYFDEATKIWKLPWCNIYSQEEFMEISFRKIVIPVFMPLD